MRRLAAGLLVLALLAACETGAVDGGETSPVTPSPAPEPAQGGTVTISVGEEPSNLVPLGPAGAAARRILEPVLWGAYVQLPDMTWAPQLLADEAQVTTDPFTVTYLVRTGARWNDGQAVTSDDFMSTARLLRDEPGYRLISRAVRHSNREVSFVFSRPYSDFRTLFDPLLPRHGPRPGTWLDAVPLATGPYEFDSWRRGEELILKRNENFWSRLGYLDEVILSFRDNDPAAMLRDGQLDVVEADADASLAERVAGVRAVRVAVRSGPEAEVLRISGQPTSDVRVRQALALALDRSALTARLLHDVQPDAEPLESLVALQEDPAYSPNFAQIRYDPDAARQLLDEAGCPLVGAVRHCGEHPLILGYHHTAGDFDEGIRWQIIAGDLADVGIGLEWSLQPQLTTATWRWPWAASLQRAATCATSSAECDREAAQLLDRWLHSATEDEALRLRDEADARLAAVLRAVPLYQRPVLLAWHRRVVGPQSTTSDDGLLWNAESWFVRR